MAPRHHVLTRPGDGLQEVEAVLAALGSRGVGREAAGLHRVFFVTRADQTVVMVSGPDAPLAVALRRAGWRDPARDAER